MELEEGEKAGGGRVRSGMEGAVGPPYGRHDP